MAHAELSEGVGGEAGQSPRRNLLVSLEHTLGMLVEGTASPLMLIFAAIEIASAVGAFYLLRRAREERRP